MEDCSRSERAMAQKVKKLTGKSFSTCLFCVRYHRGSFDRAVEMCSQPVVEDDRQTQS